MGYVVEQNHTYSTKYAFGVAESFDMAETMIYFRCHTCSMSVFIKEYDDPTSTKGCCRTCGDNDWSLYLSTLTAAEYFRLKLAGKAILPRSYITEKIA